MFSLHNNYCFATTISNLNIKNRSWSIFRNDLGNGYANLILIFTIPKFYFHRIKKIFFFKDIFLGDGMYKTITGIIY